VSEPAVGIGIHHTCSRRHGVITDFTTGPGLRAYKNKFSHHSGGWVKVLSPALCIARVCLVHYYYYLCSLITPVVSNVDR